MRLKELAALAIGRTFSDQPAGLKKGDLPLLLQIGLVANHQDNNGRAGQRPGIGQPVSQTIERLPKTYFAELRVDTYL